MQANRGVRGVAVAAMLATLGVVSYVESAHALGVIENPEAALTQSGVGAFTGWHCTGQTIEIRIDGGPAMRAGSGTPRGDTADVCGRADTGWSLLYNFNLLDGSVRHEAVAYADGEEFARVRFATTSLGAEFLRGRLASCEVLNFPELGDRTTLTWREERQNFSIESTSLGPTGGNPAPSIAGAYHGGVTNYGPPPLAPVRPAVFHVALTESILTLSIEYVGAGTCTLSMPRRFEFGGTSVQASGGTGAGACPSSLSHPGSGFSVTVDGKHIRGGIIDLGGYLLEGIKVGG